MDVPTIPLLNAFPLPLPTQSEIPQLINPRSNENILRFNIQMYETVSVDDGEGAG